MCDSGQDLLGTDGLSLIRTVRNVPNVRSAIQAHEQVGIRDESEDMTFGNETGKIQYANVEDTEADLLLLHVKDDHDQLADFRRAVKRMQERIRGARLDVLQLRAHIANTVNPLLLQRRESSCNGMSKPPNVEQADLAGRNLR